MGKCEGGMGGCQFSLVGAKVLSPSVVKNATITSGLYQETFSRDEQLSEKPRVLLIPKAGFKSVGKKVNVVRTEPDLVPPAPVPVPA